MTEQIIIFFQIVFIDLVLAGDNAIIIGMVASQFDKDSRKKIIFWGIGAAIILRIIFTLITAYLLQINGLRLIGGLLLLYIAYKLYKDVIKNETSNEQKNIGNNPSFFKAIAQAMPMPLPAPVTNAVLFFKLIFFRYIFIKILLNHYKLILQQLPLLLINPTNQSTYTFLSILI